MTQPAAEPQSSDFVEPAPESAVREIVGEAEASEAAAKNAKALSTRATTLNRKWMWKMVIITVVSIGMGLFFLYDGTVRYPKRGMEAAEFLEYSYLDVFDKERGGIGGLSGMDDPVKALAQLNERERTTGKIDTADSLKKQWLENLDLINRLGPDATNIPRVNYKDGVKVESGAARLDALRKVWTTNKGDQKASPTPLSGFDIPSQWAGMTVSLVAGFWVLYVLMRAKAKVYRWDPAIEQLTLPGGETLLPTDIEEVDKRKWDKLYVALKIKEGHAALGGKSLEFDLLRYEPLEAWILAMEKRAFPEAAKA